MVPNENIALSRRGFMALTTAAGAALTGGCVTSEPTLVPDGVDPQVARIVANSISIDMHNHIAQPPFAKAGEPVVANFDGIDLVGQLKASGLTAVCLTYAPDGYRTPQPGEWYQFHRQVLDFFDQLLAGSGVRRAFTAADVRTAKAANIPIVIQNSEGAQWIEGHLDRIEETYRRGLRHLQLLHQIDDLVLPHGRVQQLYTPPGASEPVASNVTGLTPFGADVVRECNRLGIVVDMAHGDEATVRGALAASRHPLVVSHTALDTPVARSDQLYVGDPGLVARLVSPDYARAVADGGGIMGIWRIFPTTRDYVTALKQMADVVGVEHVGIGSDTSIAPRPPAPGSRAPVPTTNTIWPDETTGFIYAVVGEMLEQGFRPDEISKIIGGNYLRLFDTVISGRA